MAIGTYTLKAASKGDRTITQTPLCTLFDSTRIICTVARQWAVVRPMHLSDLKCKNTVTLASS